MSYELKIDPKSRAAGRFIGSVRKALIGAAIEEKKDSGITQQKVADCLGVNRSVINRMLRGSTNLTLRSVAELAWALGWEPTFSLRKRQPAAGNNKPSQLPPAAQVAPSIISTKGYSGGTVHIGAASTASLVTTGSTSAHPKLQSSVVVSVRG